MNQDLKTLIILFKTHRFVFDHVKATLGDCAINLNEFTAMEALYSKGKMTTNELIQYVLIANSSMTYVLDILKEKKYITRTRDKDDKRIQYLELTEHGRTFFAKVYANHEAHMRKIFDVLTTEEEQTLQPLLKKVGVNAVRSS